MLEWMSYFSLFEILLKSFWYQGLKRLFFFFSTFFFCLFPCLSICSQVGFGQGFGLVPLLGGGYFTSNHYTEILKAAVTSTLFQIVVTHVVFSTWCLLWLETCKPWKCFESKSLKARIYLKRFPDDPPACPLSTVTASWIYCSPSSWQESASMNQSHICKE